MLGDKVSATEAERRGMIYKVLADECFAEESINIVATLFQMRSKALAYTKMALNASLGNSLPDRL